MATYPHLGGSSLSQSIYDTCEIYGKSGRDGTAKDGILREEWEDNLESLSKNPGNRNTHGRNSDTIILHRNKPKLDVIQTQ